MSRLAWIVGVSALCFGCSCGGSSSKGSDGGSNAADAPTGQADAFTGPYDDFPADPVIDMDAPTDGPSLFGDPSSGDPSGGPCLVEPEIGTLFPKNWLRPRFSWTPGGGQNLFELRLSTANEVNDLVVYTTATTWTMSADIWNKLRLHIVDAPITVTIRGAAFDGSQLTSGPAKGSSGDITIAPVGAPGAVVYWTTTGGSALRGFRIGDESVQDIVRPVDAGAQCVGCHSSSPDGTYVGFSASPVANNGNPATFGLLTADGNAGTAPFVSAAAQTLMARQNQELPVFSRNHWTTGDHVALTMFPVAGKFEITWTDLEATATDQGVGWGILARTGDTNPAAYASFAHLSDDVLYVSAPNVASGVTVSDGDLAVIPYANRAGGNATLISGASDSSYNEYYPTWSPDDSFIAFNRVASGQSSYNNGNAEVFIIDAAGGVPTRLAANDPPMCSGKTSPGVTNSWPKWAPEVGTANNKRYYWLTFSSTRSAAGNPQLYIAPVVVDDSGVHTYPALYLWNQPAAENNHTPAWDNFAIP